MSMAQYGREIANHRIAQMIEDARSTGPSPSGKAPRSLRFAGVLRRMADRIDPSGARAARNQQNAAC
jgi:hypothetical protein